MISSGGFLRKSHVEIDFYMRFCKETTSTNHGFLLAVFLMNRM
jgi:hypothetical protein